MNYVDRTAKVLKAHNLNEKKFYSNCFTAQCAPQEIKLKYLSPANFVWLTKQRNTRNVFRYKLKTGSEEIENTIKKFETNKLNKRIKKYLSLKTERSKLKSYKKRKLLF